MMKFEPNTLIFINNIIRFHYGEKLKKIEIKKSIIL